MSTGTAAPAVSPAGTGSPAGTADIPCPYRVVSRRVDTADTVTLTLEHPGPGLVPFAPGQFAMLTAFGVGEVPVSVSGIPAAAGGGAVRLVHTLRAVGAVTRALHRAEPGGVIGVRGPFGTGWDVGSAAGRDVLVVAGGIGLAPLRPVIDTVLADRARFGHLVILVGARTPADLLYTGQLRQWERIDGVQVEVTVDRPDEQWRAGVGVITTLIPAARFRPAQSVAFVCGPEVMMRFAADALLAHGVPAGQVQVSVERNMRCGVGWCGHCQLGPLLVCRDGPVLDYHRAADLMTVPEL